ncbi:MAG: UTP--glucose-1-phosphate uridylyltransferase [Planctomycetes bacterium]|jgi:UDP-N-acetylglucosamine/UDP-N-acetylgalactosamine diphosphorylase|nr:UTP--glucose-1-phosphate uridylyltransferase [Planctomycetota bacterium]
MEADTEHLRQRFEQAGQGHVFAAWPELAERARRRLARQLAAVDLGLLAPMRDAIAALSSPPPRKLAPAPAFALADEKFPYLLSDAARAVAPAGERALARGEVAVILVAGGQGTRLGFDGPKGCFPILPLSGMTLFEVFARKLRRAGRDYGRIPPLYVMVGNHNEQATTAFFEQHGFFGLNPDDVRFFAQSELPGLDDSGKLVMAGPDALWTAPDGHGGVVSALHQKGMLADMRARGVRYASYIQVDNPQIPVADPAFLGLHISEGAEVSLKVVRKTDPAEKVGIFCLDDGVPCIVEYTEFTPEDSRRSDENGRLVWWQGSIAVHVFGIEFLQRLADTGTQLPLHAARKKAGEAEVWKFERFVFDTIPLAARVVCLEVPREEQFLPLKNPDGPFGPEGVRQALQRYWKKALRLARPALPEPPAIEVDPLLCENARELAAALEDRKLDATGPLRLEP